MSHIKSDATHASRYSNWGRENVRDNIKNFSYTKKNLIVHPGGQLNILFVKFS